jgi:hypothetical protein
MLCGARYLVCYVITVRQLNRIIAITELKGNQQQKERSNMIITSKNKAKKMCHVSCGLGPHKTAGTYFFLSTDKYTVRFSELKASINQGTNLQYTHKHKKKLVGIRRLNKIMKYGAHRSSG